MSVIRVNMFEGWYCGLFDSTELYLHLQILESAPEINQHPNIHLLDNKKKHQSRSTLTLGVQSNLEPWLACLNLEPWMSTLNVHLEPWMSSPITEPWISSSNHNLFAIVDLIIDVVITATVHLYHRADANISLCVIGASGAAVHTW